MKVSENWLREWVKTDASSEEIAEQLIMAGTELDGVNPVASDFSNVVVGQIKTIEQHPDADRLRVCQVDVDADELLQIVTNASVVEEQIVPVAMIGAELPEVGGKIFKIKKSKLRGVESQGMFCGAETLGMGDRGEGLLEVPTNAALGVDIREILDLDDRIMELDITPNRADLLSVAGAARELGTILEAEVSAVTIEDVDVVLNETFPVEINAPELCQRYAGRIIRDVNTQAETPAWLKEKLMRSDIRSLGPVVDVTNYVMMELGQPMHGFDFEKLSGGINVRTAKDGEKLTLLDGKEATLRADTLVIADHEKALALAGIMGGADSAVSEGTQHIYLESAYFVSHEMMGKARSYGLHTESSHRFERGVSPDLQRQAMERATRLIVDICGGKVGEITDVSVNEQLCERDVINFERYRIKRHLGVEIEDRRVEDILTRLGCEVVAANEGWQVIPPVFRFDLVTQEDLIEEVARIYGYNNIPARLRPMTPMISNYPEARVNEDVLRSLLVDRGYHEAITYSFVPSEIEAALCPDQQQIVLSNPISEELSVMRGTLWSGLVPALAKNVKRQQARVRLFETGLSFVKTNEGMVQRKKLAGAITGSLYPEHWNHSNREVDFFDIKGDVELLLAEANAQVFRFELSSHKALHPGQSAAIFCNDTVVGYCGALHPEVQKILSMPQKTYVFELDVDLIGEKAIPAYQGLSPYPSVRRDMAILINQQIESQRVEQVIMNLGLEALKEYRLFDVYVGEGVENNQKSLAFGLIFQAFSRTLEDTEISQYLDKIVKKLEQEFGAKLR